MFFEYWQIMCLGGIMRKLASRAFIKGQKSLSEFDSKRIIEKAGVPVVKEYLVNSCQQAQICAQKMGYPVVLKGCSQHLTHKTELGLVKLNLFSKAEVKKAYNELVKTDINIEGILVQEMISGEREFFIGLMRDPQFGPCVMFGIGGIYTELFNDVSIRVAPVTKKDADDMLEEIRARQLLNNFRNTPAVDREILKRAIIGIGDLALENENIEEIDINPIKIRNGKPVAVDALVILNTNSSAGMISSRKFNRQYSMRN